jgi:hypothetical protein
MIGNAIAGLLGVSSVAATSYESISTTTVGAGGVSSVVFSSIPASYTHLQIRGIYRSSRASTRDNLALQFNTDTAANYSDHELYGTGSSALAAATTSATSAISGTTSAASIASNIFGSGVIDILDYANTNKYKTIRALSGFDDNSSSGQIWFFSGNWRSTSAITSITIFAQTGNLTQYSSFALYGIKGS